jgi:phospholipid/cholesterol/gamma-HCH transport system permease protein
MTGPTANTTASPTPRTSAGAPASAGLLLRDGQWRLSGHWTVHQLGSLPAELSTLAGPPGVAVLDGSALAALDSAGAWLLRRWLRGHHADAELRNWPPRCEALMRLVLDQAADTLPEPPRRGLASRVGRSATQAAAQAASLLHFIGEVAMAAGTTLRHPRRMRWRAMQRNIQLGGFDALPIIGITSFLLGVVVACQGADQLRHYGANIFVVDLVGYAMLREFAPLMSAIIIAGRSGSAYAAQIGTMVVTEEVDAMRTMAIDPIELLVLPKLLALAVALPLLTVFADLAGVFGGMVMARSQLGIGFHEFIDRFGREMQGATLLIGVGKALVFAVVIATIGCFQGFRTRGSADSVGRQTTTSVVQSIFLVIVADALFSIAFNVLGL